MKNCLNENYKLLFQLETFHCWNVFSILESSRRKSFIWPVKESLLLSPNSTQLHKRVFLVRLSESLRRDDFNYLKLFFKFVEKTIKHILFSLWLAFHRSSFAVCTLLLRCSMIFFSNNKTTSFSWELLTIKTLFDVDSEQRFINSFFTSPVAQNSSTNGDDEDA